VRFPGSGGGCDAASRAFGVILFMQQEKKRFVEKVDYLTSVGWLRGGNSRWEAGYKRGGPMAVVTNLGVMKFDEQSRRMYLAACYPGVTPTQVAENTGFALDLTRAETAVPPSEEELTILRRDVDPQRLILGPAPE
jgi:glutaconate CoA-transferase subunit B